MWVVSILFVEEVEGLPFCALLGCAWMFLFL